MKNITKQLFAVSALALIIGAAPAAKADGFLGGIINAVAPGVGTQLDRINHQLGNPVDHAAAATLDGFVPGAGGALEAGWAIQRSGILQGPQMRQSMGSPMQQPLGNACITPVGKFYGPLNPLGMPCQANTPFGPHHGFVGN